jgi:hypothetical protein
MKKLGYLCVEIGLFFALWAAIGVRDMPLWRVILVGLIVGLFVSLGSAKGQAA